eukprot:m51a1_g9301 putative rna polymerase i and iii transcription factor complex component (325) ;mRNA; r:64249-65659
MSRSAESAAAAAAAPSEDAEDADEDFEGVLPIGRSVESNPGAFMRAMVTGGLSIAGLTDPSPAAGSSPAPGAAGDFQDEEGDETDIKPAPETPQADARAPTPQTPAAAAPQPRTPALTPHTIAPSTLSANVLQLRGGIQALLQNIVSTVNLNVELDLKEIALKARNAEYNPKRFAAVVMRIREPKTTALIFRSGKMVCTGAKTEDSSKLAAKKYARIIQKLGYTSAKFIDFKVQNIVASCDLKFPIRLEALATSQPQWCKYEPEIFPGLVFRVMNPKVVLLIFVSGKIVLTGAKTRQDIDAALNFIYPVLLNFKKQPSGAQQKK